MVADVLKTNSVMAVSPLPTRELTGAKPQNVNIHWN
jgi:hypothetical protein